MASPALKKVLESKALAVGLLVAVAGSAFLVAYTFFRKGGYGERDSYAVHAFFDDITGLTWKSRVQIAGIQVGEVSKVTLVGGRARLDMRVKKDVPLRADTCLVKRYPSALLPDALLEATQGSARAPLLKDLPGDNWYKIVFMRRKLEEVIASQNKMPGPMLRLIHGAGTSHGRICDDRLGAGHTREGGGAPSHLPFLRQLVWA